MRERSCLGVARHIVRCLLPRTGCLGDCFFHPPSKNELLQFKLPSRRQQLSSPMAASLCLRLILSILGGLTFPLASVYAQGSSASNSFLAGGSFLYLSNSADQGGTGARGYSLITEGEILYSSPYLASGAFFNYDHQGQYERDTSFGYKLQLGYGGAYFEYGYAFLANRAFTDRSIAQQQGTASHWGIGLRVTSALFPRILFQLSIKTRTQLLTKQDGKTLDEEIIQTNTYPLLGAVVKI